MGCYPGTPFRACVRRAFWR